MSPKNETKRQETREEVKDYISKLRYAIKSGSAKINLIKKRVVDKDRAPKFTNSYTLAELFPKEDYVEAMKKELLLLTVENYVETVKDARFPRKTEMRVFGKSFTSEDVYIKLRVELISVEHASGGNYVMIMSFHFAERKFKKDDFPFRKIGECR